MISIPGIQDTIVAPITAQGVGAIAVIRVSGPHALSVVQAVFRGKSLSNQPSHTLHFGEIRNGQKNIDEVIVALFKAPRSFTQEDCVEISCHGSPLIVSQIIKCLIQSGARMAEPGEFSKRAFLHGRFTLMQAEAVADLIQAETELARKVAYNQMRGHVATDLVDMRQKLIDLTALIELELDFGEEDVEFAKREELEHLVVTLQKKIDTLEKTFTYGNAIKKGVPVAIVGKPNVGKSSLLNYLIKEDRALVSPIAGTTRDAIEETITMKDIVLRFTDTAGLRQTVDTIENMGMEKTRQKMLRAKLVLYLFDPRESNPHQLIEELKDLPKEKTIFICATKADLQTPDRAQYIEKIQSSGQKIPPDRFHLISIKESHTINSLTNSILDTLRGGINPDIAMITNERHREALTKAMASLTQVRKGLQSELSDELLTQHLKETIRHIGSVTGHIDMDKDVLGSIFGRFCIGK